LRWWLAASLALTVVACRKPVVEDPAEVAYHHAIELFAKASAESHDLSYRDPRFDAVLTALGEVPQGTSFRAKADQLVQQIVLARAEADRIDHDSNNAISQALAPVQFNPLERSVPLPSHGKPAAGPQPSTAPTAPEATGYAGTAAVPRAPGERKLPDWYRQAGYLGLGKRPGTVPGAAPTPTGVAAAPAAETPEVAAAPPATESPAAPASPSAAPNPSSPPTGPPQVFGLPGPAGRAVMGRP
jgi:hypothetical protein